MNIADLRNALSYDCATGEFCWRHGVGGVLAGAIAGNLNHTGYIYIGFRRRVYLAHRLAWFYVHGEWPRVHIDHINGDKTDNRLANLREATRSQNEWNRRIGRNNTSGVKGVTWAKATGKWQASIRINGQPKYLGQYQRLTEAAAVYRAAAETYFGEFALHKSRAS